MITYKDILEAYFIPYIKKNRKDILDFAKECYKDDIIDKKTLDDTHAHIFYLNKQL